MIAKLEKYSKNLEEIVNERTDQLREEKRRTEELLHQMLPPCVNKFVYLPNTVSCYIGHRAVQPHYIDKLSNDTVLVCRMISSGTAAVHFVHLQPHSID